MIKRVILLSVACISVVYGYPAFEKMMQSKHREKCPFLQKMADTQVMTDADKEKLMQCPQAHKCPYLQKKLNLNSTTRNIKSIKASCISTCLINHMNMSHLKNIKKKGIVHK
jgi:hypothetical protein